MSRNQGYTSPLLPTILLGRKYDTCPEGWQLKAPQEITNLVERFESNKESYKSGHYNETQVRREFVDPFFKALGWDIDNEQGFAEAYKDVIHEDAIKVGGTTKAPDYSFRIGGQRKFFLEAKKPSVDIKRRYPSCLPTPPLCLDNEVAIIGSLRF